MDTTISSSNAGFSTNAVPAGTPFVLIRPGTFNSIIGVPINGNNISAGSLGVSSSIDASFNN